MIVSAVYDSATSDRYSSLLLFVLSSQSVRRRGRCLLHLAPRGLENSHDNASLCVAERSESSQYELLERTSVHRRRPRWPIIYPAGCDWWNITYEGRSWMFSVCDRSSRSVCPSGGGRRRSGGPDPDSGAWRVDPGSPAEGTRDAEADSARPSWTVRGCVHRADNERIYRRDTTGQLPLPHFLSPCEMSQRETQC